jgi:hypothetical protein
VGSMPGIFWEVRGVSRRQWDTEERKLCDQGVATTRVKLATTDQSSGAKSVAWRVHIREVDAPDSPSSRIH